MTIYGRGGGKITVKRTAVLSDVERLDGRKPDKQDKDALKLGSYVVVVDEYEKERLYHQCFMRADGGSLEISQAIAKANIKDAFPLKKCAVVKLVTQDEALKLVYKYGQKTERPDEEVVALARSYNQLLECCRRGGEHAEKAKESIAAVLRAINVEGAL